jgi:mannitol/fructose-specific phosphotransferase system IIA component (Ntr-type)
MNLSEILRDFGIVVNLNSKKKTEALKEILQILANANKIEHKDIPDILNDLLDREEYMSTGMVLGVARPHTHWPCSCVTQKIIVLGLSKEGINWESMDGRLTHIIYLILEPKGEYTPGWKIRFEAKFWRLLRHSCIREKLLECDKEETIKLIEREESKGGLLWSRDSIIDIFCCKEYQFSFFCQEEERMHVHVWKNRTFSEEVKFWLEPSILVAQNYGLSQEDIQNIQKIIEERNGEIKNKWKKHFQLDNWKDPYV